MQNWLMRILRPKPFEEILDTRLNSEDLRNWLCMAEAIVLIKLLESKINIIRDTILDNCRTLEEMKECQGRITAYKAIINYVKSARKPREEKPNAK